MASCLDSTLRLLRPFHTHLYAPPSLLAADQERYAAHVSPRDAFIVNVHKRIKRTCPVRSVDTVKTFSGHVAKKYSCPVAFVDASSSSLSGFSGLKGEGETETETETDAQERRRVRREQSSASTLVLSGSEDPAHGVCVWELQSEALVGRLRGHSGPVLALHHSEKHGQAASGAGGGDCSVRVWGPRQEEEEEGGEEGGGDSLSLSQRHDSAI